MVLVVFSSIGMSTGRVDGARALPSKFDLLSGGTWAQRYLASYFRKRTLLWALGVTPKLLKQDKVVLSADGAKKVQVSAKACHLNFRTHLTTTRDRNLHFQAAVSTAFLLIFSSGLFFLFILVFCAIWSGDRPKTWRNLPDFWAEKKE